MLKRLASIVQVAVLVLVGLLTVPLAMAAQQAPERAGPLGVITALSTDPTADIAAAGGSIIGPTRAPFGVFAAPDTPGFAHRLSKVGYWTVHRTALFAPFCGDLQT